MTVKYAGITLLFIAMSAGIGIARAQSAAVPEAPDEPSPQAQIVAIINTAGLTGAEKAEGVAGVITASDASVAYLSFLIQTALDRSAPADRDAMVSACITAIAIRYPAATPRIIANEVSLMETEIAAKVVVAASVLSPKLGISATQVNEAIQNAVSSAKIASVKEAITEPDAVVNVDTVNAISAAVIAATPSFNTEEVTIEPGASDEETTEPEAVEEETAETPSEESAPAIRPRVVIPAIPNEIVGYGGQTTPAP